MAATERVQGRLTSLLRKGETLLGTYRRPPENFIGFEGWVDSDLFAEWRSQGLVFLRGLLGAEHGYVTSFESVTEKDGVPSSVKKGQGILRAVFEDVNGGYLFDVRQLIAAELLEDFLAMGDELLRAGYKDPAASLAGAVLEDGLRKVAERHSIGRSKAEGLDALNQKIATAGVYNPSTKAQIDSWRHIRNSADHGNFADYGHDEVRRMVDGVRELLSRHLS